MRLRGRYASGTLLLAALGACTGGGSRLTSTQRADTMSNVLFALRQAQLTSVDPMLEEQAIGCELDRLIAVVGADSMMIIAEVARARLQEVSTRQQQTAVLKKMGGRMLLSGVGCDSLAAAGKLGGPYHGAAPPGRAF